MRGSKQGPAGRGEARRGRAAVPGTSAAAGRAGKEHVYQKKIFFD